MAETDHIDEDEVLRADVEHYAEAAQALAWLAAKTRQVQPKAG